MPFRAQWFSLVKCLWPRALRPQGGELRSPPLSSVLTRRPEAARYNRPALVTPSKPTARKHQTRLKVINANQSGTAAFRPPGFIFFHRRWAGFPLPRLEFIYVGLGKPNFGPAFRTGPQLSGLFGSIITPWVRVIFLGLGSAHGKESE